MTIKKIIPNPYACEGCDAWDEVNGCWNDCAEYCDENCLSGSENGPDQDKEYKEEGEEP